MAEKEKEVKEPTQKELNALEIKSNGFLNPFSTGVSYEAFLEAVGKDKTVEEYLKGKVTKEQLTWLLIEINNFKNK